MGRPARIERYPDEVWAEALTHAGLVAKTARRFIRPGGLDREELVQEGLIGACRAITTYDPSKGAKSTYVGIWAAERMGRAVNSTRRMVRVPKCAIALANQLRRDPAHPAFTKLTRRTAASAATMMSGRVLSDRATFESMPDPERADPVEDRDEAEVLKRALDSLDDRGRFVVAERYGFDGRPPRTMQAIADELGLARSFVYKIEKKALAALRKALSR